MGRLARRDNEGNRELTNRLTRQSYPLGIIVNRDGERFVDEGADFRNYTYARYGAADPRAARRRSPSSSSTPRTRPLLRTEEYDMPGVSVAVADTIEELARRIGVDPDALAADGRGVQRVDRPTVAVRPDGQGRPASRRRRRRRATGRRRSTRRRSTPTR